MPWKKTVRFCIIATALFGFYPENVWAVTDDDLDQIRQSINQLEARHEEDAKRIKELEQKLSAVEAKKTASPSSSVTTTHEANVSNGGPVATSDTAPDASQGSPSSQAPASAGAFNPAIGGTLMGTYAHFSRNPDNAPIPGFAVGNNSRSLGPQGFSLGESEVNLSANIDPFLYGQLVMSLPREGSVDVEEGFIQTTSLPYGLSAKAGRFFSAIGYMNEQHQHAWDFLDAPLPYRAMLDTQLGDEGLQLRWLAPLDTYLQFGVEGLRGDKYPATPTHQGAGAESIFARAGGDIDESSSWLSSLAYYHADAGNRATGPDIFTGSNDIGIAGLVYKWAPDGNPVETNFKLQGEFFFQHQKGLFDSLSYKGDQTGFYGQAIYQFMPRWATGVRYDQLSSGSVPADLLGSALDNQGHNPNRVSGVLTYDTSEFGRFRLQYNYDNSAPFVNQAVMLNYTISMGAHGAHQY